MMKLTELPIRHAQHVILHGDPKSGKSQLAGELSRKFNLVWFSIDSGHSVLHKLPREQQERISICVLPDTKEYPIGIETMLKVVKAEPITLCAMHGKVNCITCTQTKLPSYVVDLSQYNAGNVDEHGREYIVVIDHITQLARSAMSHITKSEKEGDLYKPTWDDHRVQGILMDKLLSSIQIAKYHCVCMAHCIEAEMESGTKKLLPYVGSREFSRTVGGYFDHIIYFDIRNMSHAAGSSTVFSPGVLTGSRGDVAIEKQLPHERSLIPFIECNRPPETKGPSATPGQIAAASLATIKNTSSVVTAAAAVTNNDPAAVVTTLPVTPVVTGKASKLSPAALAAMQALDKQRAAKG